MIKIIKYGTRRVTTCNECKCKFSYEREDVINEDLDNYKAYQEYVSCPQCGEKVLINATR